jgi:hypothetical protein
MAVAVRRDAIRLIVGRGTTDNEGCDAGKFEAPAPDGGDFTVRRSLPWRRACWFGRGAAFLYEQFSAIESAALACQPPARDDKAGFGRNLASARTAFVLALQAKGLSPEQAEAEAARRSAEQRSRITSMIEKGGCDSDQMIPLLRKYFEISAWDPGKGPDKYGGLTDSKWTI